MAHRSRPALTLAVALTATLGFVGVSAALEGEDPTLGEPEVTCPEPPGATDEGTTGGASDGTEVTDEGTTDGTEITDEGATDGTVATDDGVSEGCDEPTDGTDGIDSTDEGATTTDGAEVTDDDGTEAAPEVGAVDNHGAAVSQAAHECPTGPEHGPCVREVARSDAGKPAHGPADEADAEVAGADEPSAAKGHGNRGGKGKRRG